MARGEYNYFTALFRLGDWARAAAEGLLEGKPTAWGEKARGVCGELLAAVAKDFLPPMEESLLLPLAWSLEDLVAALEAAGRSLSPARELPGQREFLENLCSMTRELEKALAALPGRRHTAALEALRPFPALMKEADRHYQGMLSRGTNHGLPSAQTLADAKEAARAVYRRICLAALG